MAKNKECLWKDWGCENLEDITSLSTFLGAEGIILHILPEMSFPG